jgi:hypothetical protein
MAVCHDEHERIVRQLVELGLGRIHERHAIGARRGEARPQLCFVAWVDQHDVAAEVIRQAAERLADVPRAEDRERPPAPGERLVEERDAPTAALAGLLGQGIGDDLGAPVAALEQRARVLDREELQVPASDRPEVESAFGDDHARARLARRAALDTRDDDERAGDATRAQVGEGVDPVLGTAGAGGSCGDVGHPGILCGVPWSTRAGWSASGLPETSAIGDDTVVRPPTSSNTLSPLNLTALAACCVALAFTLCAAAPLHARQEGRVEQDNRPEVPRELQVQIDRAIDRGVETLIEQQELDGSWRHDLGGYGAGATGLVAYTLMKCGVNPQHAAVVRAFEFMQRHPPSRTYSIATVMMAIAARGNTKDRAWMGQLLDTLLACRQSGGWGYPDDRPDLSNTQFAGLGLRAADLLGVDVKQKAWDDLGEDTLEYLESTLGTSAVAAGFLYERGKEPHPSGSMTAAGLTLVAIVLEHVQANRQALLFAKKRALTWLDQNFSVDFNPMPGTESGRRGWDLYYLYGLERVGSLFGIDSFGAHPWYELGARRLVREQDGNGRWGSQADTCFALLFLARATNVKTVASGQVKALASTERGLFGADDPLGQVSVRASGTTELTIWISSFGDRIRRSYAPDDAGQKPLPVKRVEYFIARMPSDEPPTTCATLVADPATPPKDPRFAIKHMPIGPAEYEVFADVTLVDYADGSDVVLRSKPIKVRVGLTQHPAFLNYARDPDRNELATLTFTTTASSQHEGADHAPHLAVDNLQATGWRASPTDTRPWLRLEFERPPRAGELVLSPSLNPADLAPTARPTRVRITLNNDEKTPIEASLDPDPRQKTRIPLPKSLRLRTLHIELLTFTKGPTGPGLNELELRPLS